MTRDPLARRRRLALAALFLSGAAGLVHEVVWAKLLGRLIGSTAHAQALVLALFMGGLAIGAVRYGRRAGAGSAGLRLYGRLELFVGFQGLALPALAWLAAELHDLAAPFVFGMPTLSFALRFVLAAAIALPPAIWMGGTLPVLAACLTRSAGQARSRVGALYAVNNLGAVLGSLAAGFVLLASFGVFGSLVVAAALNFASAALGFWLARREDAAPPAPASEAPVAAAERVSPAQAQVAMVVLALSGYAAMGYESVMSRIIALSLGGTTYSFTLMLAAFITGIGLGSAIISRWRVRRTLELLGVLQLAAGAAFLAMTPAFSRLPYWAGLLRIELQDASQGFELYQLAKAGLCLLVLLIPTACLGAGFPLVAALQVRSVAAVGTSVGRVYAWNTVGNVLGVLVTGLVVLPIAGLGVAFASCVGVSFLAGLLALAACEGSLLRRAVAPALAAAAVILQLAFGSAWLEPLQKTINHLRLRHRTATDQGWGAAPESSFAAWKQTFVLDLSLGQVTYFGEDANATVLAVGDSESAVLAVNSKPDASVRLVGSDMSTQVLLGHLPALSARDRRTALVIGYGSGVTAGALLQHPFRSMDIVEISPAVLAAHEVFRPFNHDALGDPRVSVHAEDGRAFLRAVPRRYDVISSEPSNPWLAGIGALFTVEFFENARDRLEPGGVFCAWMHQYEQTDEGVQLVLRTMAAAFPSVSIHRVTASGSDLVLLGRNEDPPADFAQLEARFNEPAVWKDLQRIGVLNLSSLLVMEAVSPPRVRAILPPGPVNSELHQRLEYLAPEAAFRGTASSWLGERYGLVRRGKEPTESSIDGYLSWRASVGDPVSRHEMEVAVAFAGESLSPEHPLNAGMKRLVAERPLIEDEGALRPPARRLLPDPAQLDFELAFQTAARFHLGNEVARAVPYYERAFELRPTDANACGNLGTVLNGLRRHDDAAVVLERGLRASPDSVELARDLAATWVALDRGGEARVVLQALVDRVPDPTALAMLGYLRELDGEPEVAGGLYRRAIEVSGGEYWAAVEKLGRLLAASGQASEACSVIAAGLKASPGQPRLLELRAKFACPPA